MASTPPIEVSWSIIPHGTPEAACSARWQARASSSGERGVSRRARAIATSRAALDDSPAPMGIVVEMRPSKPCVGRTSATTAAT